MRMTRTHKVVVTTVVTTIATAAVLTFTRGDTAPADRIASLPQASTDAPVVAGRTPAATKKPNPNPSATTPTPVAPTTPAPKPAATSDKPSKPSAKPPKATTDPAPSPSPSPSPKNLLDILLGN